MFLYERAKCIDLFSRSAKLSGYLTYPNVALLEVTYVCESALIRATYLDETGALRKVALLARKMHSTKGSAAVTACLGF